MKISEYAKLRGVTYTTVYRWIKAGALPCRWERTHTGRIVIYPNDDERVDQLLSDTRRKVAQIRNKIPLVGRKAG